MQNASEKEDFELPVTTFCKKRSMWHALGNALRMAISLADVRRMGEVPHFPGFRCAGIDGKVPSISPDFSVGRSFLSAVAVGLMPGLSAAISGRSARILYPEKLFRDASFRSSRTACLSQFPVYRVEKTRVPSVLPGLRCITKC